MLGELNSPPSVSKFYDESRHDAAKNVSVLEHERCVPQVNADVGFTA
jgi:hypothetical protein